MMTNNSLHQLEQLALSYSVNRQYEAALALYEQLALLKPNNPAVTHNIGSILIQLNRPYQAITILLQTLKLQPNNHLTFIELGHSYNNTSQFKLAKSAFKQAIKLRPLDASTYYHLGNTCQLLGQYRASIAAYKQSLGINPHQAPVLNNLGNVYRLQNKPIQAQRFFHQALITDPAHANTHNNMGIMAELKHDLNIALTHYQTAAKLDPNHYVAMSNAANIYIKKEQFAPAKKLLRQAIIINPRHSLSYFRLGLIHQHLHQPAIAKRHFDTCLKLDPQFTSAYGYAYYMSATNCDWKDLKFYKQRLDEIKKSPHQHSLNDPFIDLFIHPQSSSNLQTAVRFSQAIQQDMQLNNDLDRFSFALHSHQDPLRIGYLSQSFHRHPISQMIEPLLRLHDRRQFSVHTFSYSPNDHSSYYRAIQENSDSFTDIKNLNYQQTATTITKKHIDILVDIACYTAAARPQILALRPAPIQISYLAYPGTTGASFFDYLIADKLLIPLSDRHYYTEKIIYLPHTYQLTNPYHPISPKSVSREMYGLPSNGIIYSVFNQYAKIDPEVFLIWMNILKLVPSSVLWFINQGTTGMNHLRHHAIKHQINPNRLIFSDSCAKDMHLKRHQLADIALDTFIYNGHTTTTDALLAGIPVVTYQGNHFASRVAASLLTALGLPKLITHSPKEYQQLAIRLATHPDELTLIKSSIVHLKSISPLFDTPRFVDNLESGYRHAYKRFSQGKTPQSFIVQDNKDTSPHHSAVRSLKLRQPTIALYHLKQASSLDPQNPEIIANTGTAYKQLGDYQTAKRFYRRAIKLNPDHPEYHFNLGQTHLQQDQWHTALTHLTKAKLLGSKYPNLELNLALCHEALNHHSKAITRFNQLIHQKPHHAIALTHLTNLYQKTWQWDNLYQLTPILDRQPTLETPYSNLLRSNDKKLNLFVAKYHSDLLKSTIQKTFTHQPPITNHLPLNIGYLSPDFGDHVMSYHTYPLFQLHNRHHFKIHTYSYGSPNQSPYLESIQAHSDIWRDLNGKKSADIACQINHDHIDILIDLAGHTGNSRFDIMAHRPAPIQVHYLGFPGSTGADYIDYLLTDKIITPPYYQKYFSEKLVYLPNCYQLNTPEKINPLHYTRSQMGLPENGVVFCSFNQSHKITPEVFLVWLKLLKHVPDSVLWLAKSNNSAVNYMQQFAKNHGINPHRLIFAPFIEFDQHLDRLTLADIALDPFLYNGGATTSDALLADVPVITKTGHRYVSRMSTSLLHCLGLPECIATSTEVYYRIALELATHSDRLKSLKSKIKILKSTSPLFNPKLFVINLESAYQTLWQNYISKENPPNHSQ